MQTCKLDAQVLTETSKDPFQQTFHYRVPRPEFDGRPTFRTVGRKSLDHGTPDSIIPILLPLKVN